MKLFAALTLLLLGSSQSFATMAGCADKYEILDGTTIQTTSGNTECFISIHPRNTYNLTYRDFLFDNVGLFMVFNSYGSGPNSESTGARDYYFFPRKTKTLSYQYDAATKQLSVQSPSGKVFVFDTEKTILLSISNTTFVTDYSINPHNKGGIEITQNDGLYLDLGFQRGESPSQNPNRKITFKDGKQNNCLVKNSSVFNYTQDLDVIFKYDDSQLSKFLKRACSNLKL